MASFTRFGALAALSAAIFTGCASTTPATSLNAKSVTVNAVSAQGIGQNIGQIQLLDSPAGLVIQTNLTQLPPGPHGFHIHEKGDCSAADASSAGGHFNPTSQPHGNAQGGGAHHLGEQANLQADAGGTAKVNAHFSGVTLGDGGANDVMGKAIVVHADADDYTSQPSGNAGGRIACGVIR